MNPYPYTRILHMKAGAGLFAYVLQAVAFIHEFRNDQVIMKMDRAHFYYDANIIFTDNVWEYYFDPTGIVKGQILDYGNAYGHIMKCTHTPPKLISDRHNIEFIDALHTVFHEKIKVRKEILDKAHVFYNEHMAGMKILSVHKRNSSHYKPGYGHIEDRNGILTMDYYLQYVDDKFKNYDKIFLLTDEQDAYDAFGKRYGRDLIHYDSEMTPSGTYILDKKRGYKLGEDVLIEALLASKTDHLIGGQSNVCIGIRIMNNEIIFDLIDAQISRRGRFKSRHRRNIQ